MLIFRSKDHEPYNSLTIKKDTDHLEPVYLSPHFDFDQQSLVDPKHLTELIREIESCSRFQEFDRTFIAARLREQKFLKAFTLKEQKLAVKRVK